MRRTKKITITLKEYEDLLRKSAMLETVIRANPCYCATVVDAIAKELADRKAGDQE